MDSQDNISCKQKIVNQNKETQPSTANISKYATKTVTKTSNDFSSLTARAKYHINGATESSSIATWLCCSILTFLSWKFGRDKVSKYIPVDQCPDPMALTKQFFDYLFDKAIHNSSMSLENDFLKISNDQLSPCVFAGTRFKYLCVLSWKLLFKCFYFFGILALAIVVLLLIDYKFEWYCSQRPIKNIAIYEPNGGFSLPIFGNLFQLGHSSPLTYWLWKNDKMHNRYEAAVAELESDGRKTTTPSIFPTGADSSKEFGSHAPIPVSLFQIRLGNRRAVVVNGYRAIRTLWQTNWATNCSRPVLYTFHKVLSSGQGTTIGTTPFSAAWKHMRKVATKALNTPSVHSYVPIIEKELHHCLQELTKDVISFENKNKNGAHEAPTDCLSSSSQGVEIDIRKYFEAYALRVSLAVAYGFCPQDSSFLEEVIYVEKQINKIRSSLHSVEDYLPFTRSPLVGKYMKNLAGYIRKCGFGNGFMEKITQTTLKSSKKSVLGDDNSEQTELLTPEMVLNIRERRGKYMQHLMDILVSKIEKNLDEPCIIGNILKRKELSQSQLQSTCLTMVSAGLDTIPVNIISAIGHLSKPYGQKMQQKAFDEMVEEFMDPSVLHGENEHRKAKEYNLAWKRCMLDSDRLEEGEQAEVSKLLSSIKSLDSMVSLDSLFTHNKCGSSLSLEQNLVKKNDKCFRSTMPYLTAILWESMRYSSAQPINLARETIDNITYTNEDGIPVVIPSGTMLIMNTLAANFDETRFSNPFKFDPERYLKYVTEEVNIKFDNHKTSSDGDKCESCDDSNTLSCTRAVNVIKRKLDTMEGLPHLSFGAGSRVCAGSKLAEREMYNALKKMILCYEILPVEDNRSMETNIWELFKNVDSLVVEPAPFNVWLKPRKIALEYLNSLVQQ